MTFHKKIFRIILSPKCLQYAVSAKAYSNIRNMSRLSIVNSMETKSLDKASKQPVVRGPYSQLEQNDIDFFRAVLGQTGVLSADDNDLDGYNTDWLRSLKGQSKLVLRPKNTNEVSKILSFCNKRNLAICPQGGNTGISGGCTPVFDEIILSTSLMNQIINFDPLSGGLVCQSGCILHTLDEYLQDHGFLMPLDLGAKESCQIGGNVSTNAGGLRVLRYGSLHGTVLGLEAVLADGTILDCLSTMKKDNTGYDMKHLFIGSEGTLGVVTKVAIQCPVKPNAVNLAFLGLQNYANVLATYAKAKKELGEILSACEYIDKESMDCAHENLKVNVPIDNHPFYMIIETSGSNKAHDEEKLNKFLEDSMETEIVHDGTVVSEPSRLKTIWSIRESLPEALLVDGYLHVYDFSIPLEYFEKFVIETREYMGSDVKRVTGFGHLGDGNIHLNVTTDKYYPKISAKVEDYVYKWVAQKKGSISAEHGLGFKKRKYISYSKSNESITMMKNIKKLFDPKNILNPHKVFP